jgi:hypothetical protein
LEGRGGSEIQGQIVLPCENLSQKDREKKKRIALIIEMLENI